MHSLQYLYDQGIQPHQITLGLAHFGIMSKMSCRHDSTAISTCGGPQLEKPEMSPGDIQKYLDKTF